MRGINTQLTVTTTTDEATGAEVPLFAFPVQICKATGSQDVKFDRATPSGAPYEVVYRDSITGSLHTSDELVRGVRTGDSFTVIPEDQIAAIDEAVSMDDIRVLRSDDLANVPFDRATGFYFLQAPAKGGSHTAYRLTYEALRPQAPKGRAKTGKAAKALMVKFTSRTRQKLGAVYADEQRRCLVLVALTFAHDLREPDELVLAPQQAEIEQKQVDMARKVIDGLNGEVDWNDPSDEAIERKRELVEQAVAQGADFEVPVAPKAEAETTSADALADALEKSLATVG